ncbi:MAG: DUF3990 domain-containing protein [Oscillospiraceae bacterium]|nr:DUF3990 domain-containing protein [Oscillospiraceae bacterium]
MLLYHGSTVSVESPKIMQSERKLDFGEGFYTTYNREQALRWAERVASRRRSNAQVITEYAFDLESAERALKIIRFNNPDELWLDFVSMNRLGQALPESYDMVIGPVANDMVYTTVLLYEQGFLDKDATIRQLKVQALYNQILFHTEKSLQYCQYIRHEIIE